METQQALRKRLNSARSVKHITEAIELVAGVKYRKLMSKMEHFRFYSKKLAEMVENLSFSIKEEPHPLFEVRKVQRIGVVIVTSDRGLAGAYNSNVIKAAEKFLEENKHLQVELILYGQKAVDHFKKSKWKIRESVLNYIPQLHENNVKVWSEYLMNAFKTAELDQIWVVFTEFKNILSKKPKVELMLPLQKKTITNQNTSIDYIFEPSPEIIYQNIIPYFIYTKIQAILFESYASELAYRITSMKAAT